MIWKKLAHARGVRSLICAVLSVSVGLTMCLPAMQRQTVQPENHISETQVQDITVLQTGEAENLTSYAGTIGAGTEGSGNGENGESSGESGEATPEDGESQEDVSQEQQENNVEGTPEAEGNDPLADAAVDESDTPTETETDSGPDGDTAQDGTEGEKMGTEGEQGQQDGDSGDEGGEEVVLDLGLMMTWFKYGVEEKTIICKSGETVGKKILTAQLRNDRLKYGFALVGEDAGGARITSVTCAVGNGVPGTIGEHGEIGVSVPADPGYQNLIFRVKAEGEAKNNNDEWVLQELEFTFVIRCESGKDLELELGWQKKDGQRSAIVCAANGTAGREIKGSDLKTGEFIYSPTLRGQLASDSRLTAAEYRTASGEYGVLNLGGGTLKMKAAGDSDSETYYLTFTAVMVQRADDGETVEEAVTYTITVVYKDTVDLSLSFAWFEKGVTKRELTCALNEGVSGRVKTNQLSAGALLYELKLTGESAKDARIKAVALQNGGSSASVSESGSVPMSVPAGESSATYVFTVTVEVAQKTATFTVSLRLSGDLSLRMEYKITEEGIELPQQIICENTRTVTADTVYDDQLTDGQLAYTLTLEGDDAGDVQITEVKCYQSGNMKTQSLNSFGMVQLLLDGKKTGENRFTVTAKDGSGQTYTFNINIPFKHRGEELVKIVINLTDGMQVTNGESVNLTVRAWTEDENGKTVSNIRATGSETILTVSLDGQEIPYISASGTSQEYTLIPENPEVGDTNEHILRIYAQDEFGNFGEKVITLIGNRSQDGQIIGTATVYVDLTVLGLGVRGPVSYTVLSGESVAYTAAKVLWGEDFGEPFGRSEQSFHYSGGRIGSGTYEDSFYLAALYTGGSVGVQALTGRSWKDFGSTEEEVLSYIDSRFGKGSGLATLWRCIYRNGLNLSTETSGQIGEFDYTSGSGWMYSVGSGTYYPGQAMSNYYLRDGDVLTFRYTLAQGWDVGGGTDNYGYTVGYCVSALNGNISVSHWMDKIVNEATGAESYVCRCCGLKEECSHASFECRDMGNGTHRNYCNLCLEWFGDVTEHNWTEDETMDSHVCADCGLSQIHDWRFQGDTATCMEPGVRTEQCLICRTVREQESPITDHTTNETWHSNKDGHYQRCEVCGVEISQEPHRFEYDGAGDWTCQTCGVIHGWMDDHSGDSVYAKCVDTIYHCDICGIDMKIPGDGMTHQFESGSCTLCGVPDPGWSGNDEEETPGGVPPADPPVVPPAENPDNPGENDPEGSEEPETP